MSQEIAAIGLDLAKNVFQIHAIAHDGNPVVRRQLRRAEVLKFFAKLKQRCLVGMEACASAHYWAGRSARLAMKSGSCRRRM